MNIEISFIAVICFILPLSNNFLVFFPVCVMEKQKIQFWKLTGAKMSAVWINQIKDVGFFL